VRIVGFGFLGSTAKNRLASLCEELEPYEGYTVGLLHAGVDRLLGLDMGAIENIHKQILAERDRGAAILLISLELEEVMSLADTIGVIYNGRLLKIAAADTLTSQDVGRYMMGVTEA